MEIGHDHDQFFPSLISGLPLEENTIESLAWLVFSANLCGLKRALHCLCLKYDAVSSHFGGDCNYRRTSMVETNSKEYSPR